MSALPNTPPGVTKASVAQKLADAHRSADPSLTLIYRIEAPGRENDPGEPVKILEINPNTPASGIVPVWLTPHPPSGIYFPSIVVEIHPSEWPLVQSGQLQLPHGWRLDTSNPL